jgi:hypothetical protein|tara:strand:+ start:1108 stop:1371 length:264 start_codon:yes stop_codon:yes gene_type:complete
MNIRAILGLASVALLLVTIYEQNNAINRKKDQIVQLKKQEAILKDSLFNTSVELGRYQMTLEMLKDGGSLYKKTVDEFEYILTTQTQ